MSPSQLAQGASGVTATLNGENLVAPASVQPLGSDVSGKVTGYTANAITIKVSVPVATAPGRYSPVVYEANGVVVSCIDCLTVVAGPRITTVAPATLTPGHSTAVTVTCSGFSADAKVAGPQGVTFSAPTVSGDGTPLPATAPVA